MKRVAFTIFLLFFVSSCATGINAKQKAAYQIYQEKGLLIENRNPSTAMKMGFLPGGSSFYNGDYDVAIFNLLLWPLSVTWEAGHGRDRAMLLNYEETEKTVKKNFKKNLSELEEMQNLGEIDQQEYRVRFVKLYEQYGNPRSTLLTQYRSSNVSLTEVASNPQTNDSFLSKVDGKINGTCTKEYNSLKKEFQTLDKEDFLQKCSIDKRKKFVGLGL